MKKSKYKLNIIHSFKNFLIEYEYYTFVHRLYTKYAPLLPRLENINFPHHFLSNLHHQLYSKITYDEIDKLKEITDLWLLEICYNNNFHIKYQIEAAKYYNITHNGVMKARMEIDRFGKTHYIIDKDNIDINDLIKQWKKNDSWKL